MARNVEKLDLAVETFYLTREDNRFGEKPFCRAERVPCSCGYILFKQRENKHTKKVLIDDLIPTARRIF